MLSRFLCAFYQRLLARCAVLGETPRPASRLAVHLARCAGCRAAWEDLRALAASLPQAIALPTASRDFTAGVWNRIGVNARRARVGAAVLSVAAFTLLAALCGPRGHEARAPAAAPGAPVRVAAGASGIGPVTPAAQPPSTIRPAHDVPGRIHLRQTPQRVAFRTTTRPPVHRQRGERRGSAGNGLPHPELDAGGWAEIGARAESSGDLRLAAAAYRRAYDDTMDPALGLAAGRAAEEGGDVAEAVGYYAALLRSPSPAAGLPGGTDRPSDAPAKGD
jgi:hypothetical protein